jgi:hypothetical protein
MIATVELINLLDMIDREEAQGRLLALSLGDGELLLTVNESLHALALRQSGAAFAGEPAEHLSAWLDDFLNTAWTVEEVALAETGEALFAPFLSPTALAQFIASGGPQPYARRSLEVSAAKTYLEAVVAAWAPLAGQAVAAMPTPTLSERLANEVLVSCGLCSIPIAALAYTIPPETAYRLISALALCVEQHRQRLAQAPRNQVEAALWRSPDITLILAALDSLLKRKMAQIQSVATGLPGRATAPVPAVDRSVADRYAGALLEARGVCIEIGQQLAQTHVYIHRFRSPAARLGVTDPLVIDPTDSMKILSDLQPAVQQWIGAVLDQAARRPGELEDLNRQVDRIALALGAMQALLSLVVILERFGELDTIGPELVPTVRHLQSLTADLRTAILILIVDWEKADSAEKIRKMIEASASDAQTILTSLRWSLIVGQAIRDATDIILAIETGGQMGGIAGSLRSGSALAPALASRGAALGLLTERDIRLIAEGATVVAAVSNPQAGRRRGLRAERGLGLSPNRPRESIVSLTETAKERIPDKIPRGFRSFWEIKNVARLRMTWQLADFMAYAQMTGRKMVLYIRPRVGTKSGTVLSPSVRRAIDLLKREGLIEVRYLKIY